MAKNGKGKVPKRIAGVKVPKVLRKSALATLIDSRLGREILAEALVAAAAAAAAALVRHRPSGQQVANAGEAVVDAGTEAVGATRDTVQAAAGAVADLVTDAAQHILPASLTGKDENRRKDKAQSYSHLADQDPKGAKDKQRVKPSKH